MKANVGLQTEGRESYQFRQTEARRDRSRLIEFTALIAALRRRGWRVLVQTQRLARIRPSGRLRALIAETLNLGDLSSLALTDVLLTVSWGKRVGGCAAAAALLVSPLNFVVNPWLTLLSLIPAGFSLASQILTKPLFLRLKADVGSCFIS